MGKEIIISAQNEQTRIAIVENGELVELYIENPENERTLGDIYLARVRKIMPSIQAAFVDIGQKQDAFLHFSDIADNLPELLEFVTQENPEVGHATVQHTESHRTAGKRRRPTTRRKSVKGALPDSNAEEQDALDFGDDAPEAAETQEQDTERQAHRTAGSRSRGQRRSAQQKARQQNPAKPAAPTEVVQQRPYIPPEVLLKRDQRILVKIVKEPISTKGSRVSTDISLAGRFLVLVPVADYVAVSKKIVSYKERRRLRALAKMLLPEGFGVIIRTVAEGKNAKALDTDLRLLVDKWRKIEKKMAGLPAPPVCVHEDVNMVSSVIRDLFSDDYDRILIDDIKLYRNVKGYIQAVAPHMAAAVQQHKGNEPVFQAARIARDAAEAFESRVDLPTGGYLFIERTEAMYVVDVNSGRSGRGMTQEDNSLRVDLEAARVIARQIRLRDIGGIIVIDFIDLRDERNRQKVYDELKREFRKDRAVTKLLPMSDFGLIQITRQRLRPSITTTFAGPDGSSGDGGGDKVAPLPTRSEMQKPAQREPARVALPPALAVVEEKAPAATPEEMVRAMEAWLVAFKQSGKRRAVALRVHPFTAAYLNRKVPNQPTRWFMRHLVHVRVEIDAALDPLSYLFVDPKDGKPFDVEAAEPVKAAIEEAPPVQREERRSGEPRRSQDRDERAADARNRPAARSPQTDDRRQSRGSQEGSGNRSERNAEQERRGAPEGRRGQQGDRRGGGDAPQQEDGNRRQGNARRGRGGSERRREGQQAAPESGASDRNSDISSQNRERRDRGGEPQQENRSPSEEGQERRGRQENRNRRPDRRRQPEPDDAPATPAAEGAEEPVSRAESTRQVESSSGQQRQRDTKGRDAETRRTETRGERDAEKPQQKEAAREDRSSAKESDRDAQVSPEESTPRDARRSSRGRDQEPQSTEKQPEKQPEKAEPEANAPERPAPQAEQAEKAPQADKEPPVAKETPRERRLREDAEIRRKFNLANASESGE